jgi:hypothetical protein
MNEVPEEVIQHVLVFIPTKNYVSLASVNSTWNALFNADSPLWKYLCERDFAPCTISTAYKEGYVSWFAQRFVLFPEKQQDSVIVLSDNDKTATLTSHGQCIGSVFLKNQIHVAESTSSTYQYRFRANTVFGAGYFLGFFIDRSATNPTAKKVDSLYRQYIGYKSESMAYGFNDHGYYWKQGSGAKVPNVKNKNMFFKSRDEILLTLKVSGMNLDACCKVNQIEAHIRAIPLVKGDVIYVGATLYRELDSISVLSNSGEK